MSGITAMALPFPIFPTIRPRISWTDEGNKHSSKKDERLIFSGANACLKRDS
jgi:hypothetical protein